MVALRFLPGCDRLFALGDLIDRGPRSADALAWMESGQIELSVRGNHEQMLLDRMKAAENDREGRTRRTAHPLQQRLFSIMSRGSAGVLHAVTIRQCL